MQSKNPVDIRQWLHDFVSTFESVLSKATLFVTAFFAVGCFLAYFLQFNGNPAKLVLVYITSITTLTTVISFILNSGYLLPLLVWANIYAMVRIYPSISMPQIFQILYQLVQIMSLLVMQVNEGISDFVKTQCSTIVKTVTEIKANIEHRAIRYTHVRVFNPPALS